MLMSRIPGDTPSSTPERRQPFEGHRVRTGPCIMDAMRRLISVIAVAALASLVLLPAGGAHAVPGQIAMTAGDPSDGDSPLVDTYWVVEQVVTGDTVVDVPDVPDGAERYLILSGADSSLSAYDGCNWLVGSFEVGDAVLRLDGIGRTKRACAHSDSAEWVIDEVLSTGEVAIEIDGRWLELTHPDGRGLRLLAQA
jgi:heat shock protein HslJ